MRRVSEKRRRRRDVQVAEANAEVALSTESEPLNTPTGDISPRPVTPVGIIAAKLEALSTKLDALPDTDEGIKAELRLVRDLAAGLEPYTGRCTTPESPALRSLDRRTQEADWSDSGGLEREMLSGHVEGQLLKFLVYLSRARRVLEIGLFTGYSALAMAEALPEDGELVACEVDESVAKFAGESFSQSPDGGRIHIIVAPAMETLGDLSSREEVFDLVFIDADKGGYLGYLDAILDGGLLAPDGLICVDNTLLQGEPYASPEPSENGAAISAFNLAVAEDERVEQVLIPLRDGLTLIRRAERRRR